MRRPLALATVIILIGYCLSWQTAVAQQLGTPELDRACRAIANAKTRSDQDTGIYCLAWINGYLDRLNGEQQIFFKEAEKTICIPTDVSTGQIQQIFSRYLEVNPRVYGLPAWAVMDLALRAAFPCQ